MSTLVCNLFHISCILSVDIKSTAYEHV